MKKRTARLAGKHEGMFRWQFSWHDKGRASSVLPWDWSTLSLDPREVAEMCQMHQCELEVGTALQPELLLGGAR